MGIIFFPPVNEKSVILVNYLCLHAIQETSETFLHKEETVYKTLSKSVTYCSSSALKS